MGGRQIVVLIAVGGLLVACPKAAAPPPAVLAPPPPVAVVDVGEDVAAVDAAAPVDASVPDAAVVVAPPPPPCTLPQVQLKGDHCAWQSTSAVATDGGGATDHDSCTTWESGGRAPQTFEVSIQSPRHPATKLVVMPAMTTNGSVLHVIESSFDDQTWTERARFDGVMKDLTTYEIALNSVHPADRRFRIRTLRSPSPVAWREVGLVACLPHRIIPGNGACQTDADCSGDGCGCGGTYTCNARTWKAPGLAGAGCSPAAGACANNCTGPLDCGHGGCVCHNGKCAGWTVVPIGKDPRMFSDNP